ncbi:MAG: sigma-70 family RNA polymerase sigma factor, partial [Chloroflexota bacterium]
IPGDQNLALLEALYDAYHREALGLAYRLLQDAGDAEDVAQETFLSAWRAAPTYDVSRGSTRTWLLTMVRNRAIDRLRRRRRQPVTTLQDDMEPADDADISSEATITVDGLAARKALAGLPEEQRRVIELAYFGGLTHTEVASRLSTPVGTVKSRIRLALDRLRVALEDPQQPITIG